VPDLLTPTDPQPERRRFKARALLPAALVLLVGAVLGAAGFLLEQHYFV